MHFDQNVTHDVIHLSRNIQENQMQGCMAEGPTIRKKLLDTSLREDSLK